MEIKNIHGWTIAIIGQGSTLRESKIFKVIFATTAGLFLILAPLAFWLLSGDLDKEIKSDFIRLALLSVLPFFIYFTIYFMFKRSIFMKKLNSWHFFTYIMTFISMSIFAYTVIIPQNSFFASENNFVLNFFANLYLIYIIIALPCALFTYVALIIERRLK